MVFYHRLDRLDGGLVGVRVLSGALVAELLAEVVVDEAVLGRELRRRVPGHAVQNAVALDDGDRLAGLGELRRRRDTGDATTHHDGVDAQSAVQGLVVSSRRRLQPDGPVLARDGRVGVLGVHGQSPGLRPASRVNRACCR
nr:hypothetical protein [Halobacterium jilantaiense]